MADTGIIAGAANAYPDGIRIVGTPIGYQCTVPRGPYFTVGQQQDLVTSLGALRVWVVILILTLLIISKEMCSIEPTHARIAPSTPTATGQRSTHTSNEGSFMLCEQCGPRSASFDAHKALCENT